MTDREKLIKLIKEGECGALALEDCSYCKYDGEDDCSYRLLADVLLANGGVVREKGEWVDRYGGKYANPVYDCSKCGKSAPRKNRMDALGNWHVGQDLTDFCPNCGADMRGAVNNG